MNEDRRHAHPVDIDAGFTAIDGDPLVAVEVQDHQRRRAGSVNTVEPDVRARADADRDIAAGRERVAMRAEPDD
jgi:quercetin dioxygenase-like cupin family protein